MILRSTSLKAVARLAVAALLFTQAALVGAACLRPEHDVARAIAQVAAPPCHQETGSDGNLCVAHCLGELQSLNKHATKLPAFGEVPALVVPVPAPRRALRVYAYQAPARACTAPPRILFSRLLI